MTDVYTVNGVHYPVNAAAIARLVNQRLELLAALGDVTRAACYADAWAIAQAALAKAGREGP